MDIRVPEWAAITNKFTAEDNMYGCSGNGYFDGCRLAKEVWGIPSLFDTVKEKTKDFSDSSLVAFSYLWRRFGPSGFGWDDYKGLVSYVVNTPDPDIFLLLRLRGSSLGYSVGMWAKKEIDDLCNEPQRDWFAKLVEWHQDKYNENLYSIDDLQLREERTKEAKKTLGELPLFYIGQDNWQDLGPESPIYRINHNISIAMEEMLRPVYVRDIPFNILGRYRDEPVFTTYYEESLEDGEENSYYEAAPPYKYAGYGLPMDLIEENFKERSSK